MKHLARVLALLLTPLASAASIDLGGDLFYLRVNDLETEFRQVQDEARLRPALILDLRGATGDLRIPALTAALAVKPGEPAKLRLVLLNAESSGALRSALPFHAPGTLTLAPRATGLSVDIPVEVTPEADRAAVVALAADLNPRIHLNPTPAKRRDDEAALAQAHAGLWPSPEPTPVPPPTTRVTDALLTRAVQFHQAWQALRAPAAPVK